MDKSSAVSLALAITLIAGCGGNDKSTSAPNPSRASGAAALAPVSTPYRPKIDPANFVNKIDNQYFPLLAGMKFHYTGVAEDGKTPQDDYQVVTSQTKTILGVKCAVIRDTVSTHGKAIERTLDWYAQDKAGNVWYMGEDTRELVHGRFVKMSDSWEGGVNGAQPGIIMPGDPKPDSSYRQEYYPGHALDQAKVLGSGGTLKVAAGSYGRTLLTEESAPKIDPGVRERKWYVAGVGDVKEKTVSGNHEQIQLVSVTR
jgi:hypothetical protein